jgi:hypothetical protein
MDNSGDAWVVFRDANSGGADRLLGWDDSANAFVAEENDGGIHKLALVYDGSSSGNTNFPVGTTVFAQGSSVDRNASSTIALKSGASNAFTIGSSGGNLTGTWRCRGMNGTSGGYFQRVA